MTRPDRLSDTELSALVAEKVYGITDEPIDDCLSYATDSGLALEAALKMDESLDCFSIEIIPGVLKGDKVELSWYDKDHWCMASGIGTTVARALCFAALRANGQEVQDDS